MDLRHLRLFLVVCRHGNISSAADELGVNQPAVSKAIRRLEKELGAEVFERNSRGVDLTHYGQILRDSAGEIEATYRNALRHIDAVRAAESGEVVLGAGGTWRDTILPRAVAELCSGKPKARVRISTGSPEELTAELMRGQIDFMLAPIESEPALDPRLCGEVLLDNALVVAVRRGHPSEGKLLTLEDLRQLNWVVPFGSIIRDRYERLFQARGYAPPTPTIEIRDAACLFDIVEQTDFATYVPDIRLSGRRRGRFSVIRCPEVNLRGRSGLIMRREGRLPPICTHLTDLLRKHAAIEQGTLAKALG